MTEYRSKGKTTLTTDVITTIARMAALEVEGVNRMASIRNGAGRFFHLNEGVQLIIEDEIVLLDLYLILNQDVNIRETSREVQRHVARAVAEMTGLEVGHVNIHIEDIEYPLED